MTDHGVISHDAGVARVESAVVPRIIAVIFVRKSQPGNVLLLEFGGKKTMRAKSVNLVDEEVIYLKNR